MTNGSDARRPRIELTKVSKAGGGIRWLAVLDPITDRRLRDAVRPTVAQIERMLDPGVMGNRAGPNGRVRPLVPARHRWNRRMVQIATGRGTVLYSDVEACYPSITAEVVAHALSRSGIASPPVRAITEVLESLEREGLRGLPVGPEASAILANAVLAGADLAARHAGAGVVRWVDDVALVGPDRRTVLRSFDAWAKHLATLGLRPHDGKTSLILPGEAASGRGAIGSSRGSDAMG
ncbi:MAG: RNA-directed DNA polymerase [Actinomycetota bacterium]